MLNVSEKISARGFMWITGIVSILVALVFPMDRYEGFLFLIGAMFTPLFGIVLTDYFLVRKRRIDVDGLYDAAGPYRYASGFNRLALLSWAAGFTTYKLIELSELPLGATLPSFLVSGLLYLAFIPRQARNPAPRQA